MSEKQKNEDKKQGIDVSDYIDVDAQAATLSYPVPNEIGLLPKNFDSAKSNKELVQTQSAATVRKLMESSRNIRDARTGKDSNREPQFYCMVGSYNNSCG